jgi:hypothetical protein
MPAFFPVLLAAHVCDVSYAMAGLVGTIGVLMGTKPALW